MNMYSYVQKTESCEKTAELMKLLSDPTRLRILEVLFGHPNGMCVYEIAEAIRASASATSHQLAKLESRGILECFRDGQKICYELGHEPIVRRIKNVLRAAR